MRYGLKSGHVTKLESSLPGDKISGEPSVLGHTTILLFVLLSEMKTCLINAPHYPPRPLPGFPGFQPPLTVLESCKPCGAGICARQSTTRVLLIYPRLSNTMPFLMMIKT